MKQSTTTDDRLQTTKIAVSIYKLLLMISQTISNDTTIVSGISFNGQKLCSGFLKDNSNLKRYLMTIQIVFTENDSKIDEKIEATISPSLTNIASLNSTFITRVKYSSISPPLVSTTTNRPPVISTEVDQYYGINDSKLDTLSTKQCGMSIASKNSSVIGRSEVPWLITVFGKFGGIIRFLCNGILISDQHALTTSNCFEYKAEIIPLKTVSNLYKNMFYYLIFI